jgi:FtsZ-binding cell division protein ZapB
MPDERIEELLRINAALAAELRSLNAGRTDAPAATAMPTARRIAVILDERDALAAELEKTQAHRDEIERRNAQLAAEINRLRRGIRGYMRRTRARLGGR